jgi:DNA replication and repair protein RecF
MSAGKSFKKANSNDLIKFKEDRAEVKISFFDGKNDCDLKAELVRNEKKKIYLDGMPCDRVTDYIGRIGTVLFTPDHLSLVNAEPEYRRKFLDLALCQSKATLLSVYKEYAKLISEKSTIIKNAREKGFKIDEFLIDVYNEKLAVCCEIIANARINLCKKISKYGEAIYAEMTGGKEKISFEYSKSVDGEDNLKEK